MNDRHHGDSLFPVMTAVAGIFFAGTVAFALYSLGLYQPLVPILTIASFGGGVVGFLVGLRTHDQWIGLARVSPDNSTSLIPIMTALGGAFLAATVAFVLYAPGFSQIAAFGGGVVGLVAGLLMRDRLVWLTRFNSAFELAFIIAGAIIVVFRMVIVVRTGGSQSSLDALMLVLAPLVIVTRRRSSYLAASEAALLSVTTLYYAVAYRNPLPLGFTVLGAAVAFALIREAKGPGRARRGHLSLE